MTPAFESSSVDSARYGQAFRMFLIVVTCLVLPVTGYTLWLLPSFARLIPHPEALGLTAVSIGIIGILVFFIFLYKFQVHSGYALRRRLIALLVHAATIIALFFIVIWLGFGAPWSRTALWGVYDLETASRSWIIAVIVVGTLTLLGSFFDAMRQSGDAPFLVRTSAEGTPAGLTSEEQPPKDDA